jgi:hypothetical protein
MEKVQKPSNSERGIVSAEATNDNMHSKYKL